MKKLFFIILIFSLLLPNLSSAQTIKLKTYFSKQKVAGYNQKETENRIYPEEMKYIIHNFTLSEEDNVIDKGIIYRQFFKNGIYESFYAISDKNTFKMCYWSDPTALVTANVNKMEYCVEGDINNILFPMVIRGYAKILKTGAVEKKFKNITFKLTKLQTKKEGKYPITTFKVESNPKVMEGTIETYKGLIVLRGNLKINNDLAKRSGLKLLFSHDDLPKATIINLSFDYTYFDTPKPKKFLEMGIDDIVKKYKSIVCD
ncbi:MAG: hypothetical protein A2X64_10335 [Ignavibacteria bacterium GWF2_33_9]|nr:MAG: hypothetical protein A2X64_10335 [Ignavibacteria bacterium GWF2_33_9]